MKQKYQYNIPYLLALALTSAMGGLLFGYDWVVIGGAKPFYELFFQIQNNPTLQGWAMSSALIGCVAGAMLSGGVSDKYGRKQPLILAALLFILSAYGSGATDNYVLFIIYRVIGGVGIGMASALSPMYIAEISPAEYRGRLVAINQLTIVIGILSAQICNYLIADTIPDGYTEQQILNSWNGITGWRIMFWAEIIPASAFFVLMFFVPKSPRFLAKTKNLVKAEDILRKIGGEQYAQQEINGIQNSLVQVKNVEKIKWSELANRKLRPVLITGIILAVFQQWCGINIIFNYADEIFTSAGYSVSDMLFNIVITGSVNLAFTLIAMRVVDQLGRRKLLLFGAGGLAIIYIILGFSYYAGWSGWPILSLVILAISVYAMSLAPVTWVVLAEIFPNRVRGVAVSIATFALWVASFILTFTFPILNNWLEAHGTFWCYAGICVVGFFLIKSRLTETKGKSLEEIEKDLEIHS
ncbi:sugar porter family MFS transporter [Chondrinema litorale]|uniref:sugar porter family MFS transporter n=1 Tax=Chondrinema litorale TaxID=2994555 RepID=UPI0025439FFE|nr:sugar porter family MFS transporter [Chondrinema litorale]UZR96859.1 sugar porter family MFS transporter [Chondrinema litorale]